MKQNLKKQPLFLPRYMFTNALIHFIHYFKDTQIFHHYNKNKKEMKIYVLLHESDISADKYFHFVRRSILSWNTRSSEISNMVLNVSI